ncbi:MAG TPA: phosphatidylserine decarboxylase family protein [Steroidobacteraceae bacterium]|nr:phosphatidylserine decarboxylase family protein [Steroidobacteraceae bacterium]
MATTQSAAPYRVGEWLPSDHDFLSRWLEAMIRRTDAAPRALHPVIADFRDLIESDPAIFMLFSQMFEQVPRRPPYDRDPTGKPQVRDYQHMLQLLNTILTHAPEFDRTGLVGCPMNTILDWSMGTAAGMAAFLNERVNAQLKKVLNAWARFLSSSDSTYVLGEHPQKGWFGADARAAMPDFDREFLCQPDRPHHGFGSWDEFFTREFRPGVRPVAFPEDDAVIVNACESAPFRIAREVHYRDRFWIKSQPYSIVHMLANDALAPLFAGATVYQAYLSPLCYHRWHSPVTGRVVKAYLKDGTYYAEAASHGFDPAGPNDSMSYITEVATRALIFIEADNADIGLMCVLAVGMAEVSSCHITVYEGQRIRKGEQIGMFHYGGSTHCLIFRPGVRLEFDHHGQKPGLQARNIQVNTRIATVVGRS